MVTANSFITAIKNLNGELNRLYDIYDNPNDPIVSEIDRSMSSSSTDLSNEDYVRQLTRLSDNYDSKKSLMEDTSIRLENVFYKYPGANKMCIKNINLEISTGSITAICGPSGCGKSTLLKILSGLNQPTQGNISIGEVDFNKLDKVDFLGSMSYLDTDLFIFNDSVFNNVTLFDPSYSNDEVVEALKKAQIYDAVTKFPDGINHILAADGGDLSGGQKQRVQLARAFLRKPL